MPSWSISMARRPAKNRASGFSATAADHQILSGGTAYMTDAGMTGDYDSIIGMQKQEPLRRFTSGIPSGRFEPALGVSPLDMKRLRGDQPGAIDAVVGEVVEIQDRIDPDPNLHQGLRR